MIDTYPVYLSKLAELIENKLDCVSMGLDRRHILPIIKILLEEMLVEIKNGGLDIIGLGRFEIHQLKDHGHHDITHPGTWLVSKGKKKMRLMLDKRLITLLIDNLSRRKTFPPPIRP